MRVLFSCEYPKLGTRYYSYCTKWFESHSGENGKYQKWNSQTTNGKKQTYTLKKNIGIIQQNPSQTYFPGGHKISEKHIWYMKTKIIEVLVLFQLLLLIRWCNMETKECGWGRYRVNNRQRRIKNPVEHITWSFSQS